MPRSKTTIIPLLFTAMVLLSVFALDDKDPGMIRGNITITQDDRSDLMGRQRISDRYLSRSERSPDSSRPVIPERYSIPEKTVIYLEPDESMRSRVVSTTSRRVILDQRNMQFYPNVLAIQRGTTVVFPNNDDVYHNVFSYSRPKQFDLGRYPKGQFRTVTFDTPGIVRLYCDIHAHMNATILVLDTPYFTSPDETGYFSLPEVPPGIYTIHFWFGRNLIESRKIEIQPGSVSTVNFIY